MGHKAGFVNIIGKPNVGKSTLMNALVGEKLSIVTYKAQTTRHRIHGIVSGDDYQIVYSDTPGIVEPGYRLHHSMMRFVEGSFEDADIFLYVVEAGESAPPEWLPERLNGSEAPVLLLINKTDKVTPQQVEEESARWQAIIPAATLIPVSALLGHNLDKVAATVMELLPECPPYFPKDEFTDRSLRFIASEIIREKIFLNYRQEIPYYAEVAIEQFKEEGKITRISALIFVARESQKIIIIGKKGEAIKKVGTEARVDLEAFLGTKVFLELSVKVAGDWRDDPRALRRFGYEI